MNTNETLKLKMMSGLAVVLIGWFCSNGAMTGHAQSGSASSPQLQEVVKLTQAHMSDDVILAYIHNSGAGYNLSADDILYLHGQGVSQPVLSALLQSKPSAAPTPTTPAPPIEAAPQVPPPAPFGQSYAPSAPPVEPPPSSAPPPGSEINLSYFQSQMAPYGTWTDVPGYGQCWVPSVQTANPDWRPYFNGGHWEYTDDGWFWKSDYPWGQYAFHYGRWMHDFHYGWVWTPGYNWAPAWVSWRHAEGEGFCGWAPLPPSARFEAGVGLVWGGRVAMDVDFGLAPDAYVFIPFDHFWAHDYIGFRAPGWRVPGLFRISVVANHYNFIGGRFVVEGIGRDRMAGWTHHDIHVARIEIRDPHIEHAREMQRVRAVEVEHSRGVEGHGARGFEDHRGVEPEHRPGAVSRSGEGHPESSRGGDSHSESSRSGSKDKDSGSGK